MMLTLKQLTRFVKTRNKSGYQSNLQFQIDANACGFSIEDLGKVAVFTIDGFKGYQWKPVIARVSERSNIGEETVRLIEFGGRCYLAGQTDEDSNRMFELMNRAEFQA